MRSESVEASALNDMMKHISLAERFVQDCNYEEFQQDIRSIYAVIRCLEVISEASRRLSAALKARYPSIAWKNIAGAGNVYRHSYEDIATIQIWETVQRALPPLRVVIEAELAALGR